MRGQLYEDRAFQQAETGKLKQHRPPQGRAAVTSIPVAIDVYGRWGKKLVDRALPEAGRMTMTKRDALVPARNERALGYTLLDRWRPQGTVELQLRNIGTSVGATFAKTTNQKEKWATNVRL